MRSGLPLVLVLSLSGCFTAFESYEQLAPPERPADARPVTGPPAAALPLRPGTRLDYRARFGLGAGFFTGSATVSVTDAWSEPNGREVSAVSVVSRYFGRERRERYRFVREAGRLGLVEPHPQPHVTWFLPEELEAGARLRVETGEGPGTAVVEAVDQRVSVPAGTFPDAARVRFEAETTPTRLTLWLVPRVGLVAADVAMNVGLLPLVARLELEAKAP